MRQMKPGPSCWVPTVWNPPSLSRSNPEVGVDPQPRTIGPPQCAKSTATTTFALVVHSPMGNAVPDELFADGRRRMPDELTNEHINIATRARPRAVRRDRLIGDDRCRRGPPAAQQPAARRRPGATRTRSRGVRTCSSRWTPAPLCGRTPRQQNRDVMRADDVVARAANVLPGAVVRDVLVEGETTTECAMSSLNVPNEVPTAPLTAWVLARTSDPGGAVVEGRKPPSEFC